MMLPQISDGFDGEDHVMKDAVNGGGGTNGHAAVSDGEPDGDDSYAEMDEFIRSLGTQNQLPTGCCYDDRMKLHANADFGQLPPHPEDPRRIEEIMKMFKRAGLIYVGPDSELANILAVSPTKYMWRIAAREATIKEISSVHTEAHYRWVSKLSKSSTQELRKMSADLDQGRASIYVGAMSFDAALLAAGGAIECCKNVVEGKVKNAIAVIRPPGHHAECDQPMGFCLFNNVPIAARVCQLDYPMKCRKVLILDWDVHHGNGIQNMFYNDANTLYISIHVYANGDFYPGRNDNPEIPDGAIDSIGAGQAKGKNVNIGWHAQGMGDGEYLAAFQKVVIPIGREFEPDLVIVSAGFDAAEGDELGGCHVSPGCYAHMTHMLMSLAGGKMVVCLEGGYNLKAISQSALAVARTLMGEPPPQMHLPRIEKDAARVIAKVQAAQAPYWECMRPGVIDLEEFGDGVPRLHDVVRTYQRHVLSEKFGLLPLFIQTKSLFQAFDNQVLTSHSLFGKRRYLLIIHDPPELAAMPDVVENTVDPHNGFLIDGVYRYIEWAHGQGFGIIDINVPHYIIHPDDIDPSSGGSGDVALSELIKDLMNYIWDNFLQVTNIDDLFVLGVGNAYQGVKSLLTERVEAKDRVSGIISFVIGTLRTVKSDTDDSLASWYKKNSIVYVANDHGCWTSPDLMRKVFKKRFGGVRRSPQDSLNSMMEVHEPEVRQFITDRLHPDGNATPDEDWAPDVPRARPRP